MPNLRVWEIDEAKGKPIASELSAIQPAQANRLNELLLHNSHLLMPSLTLIGSQTAHAALPLILAGIDAEGRLALFAIPTGSITRDTLLQVLDIAAEFSSLDESSLHAALRQRFAATGAQTLQPLLQGRHHPTLALVGLEVDAATRQLVDYLARSGVEISIILFQAFYRDRRLFLVRQLEPVVEPPAAEASPTSIADSLDALQERIEKAGFEDWYWDVADCVRTHLEAATELPTPASLAWRLRERHPGGHEQVTYIDLTFAAPRSSAGVTIRISEHAFRAAEFSHSHSSAQPAAQPPADRQVEIPLQSQLDWDRLKPVFSGFLDDVYRGWKACEKELKPPTRRPSPEPLGHEPLAGLPAATLLQGSRL